MPRAVEEAYAAGTRSPDGNPGPNYWQNRSVHDIALTVMPPDRTVQATQTITYTNNAPFELTAVPVRLYQNVHRPTAMREKVYPPEFLTDGITIDSFKVNGQDVPFTPDPAASGETLKIIPLPEPIPSGGQATFEIGWHFELAEHAAKEGVIDPTTFFIAYFFPRIAPIRDDEGGDVLGLYPYYDTEEFTARSGPGAEQRLRRLHGLGDRAQGLPGLGDGRAPEPRRGPPAGRRQEVRRLADVGRDDHHRHPRGARGRHGHRAGRHRHVAAGRPRT